MEDQAIKNAQERVNKAHLAASLLTSPEGVFLQEYLNDRVSTLVSKITSATPASDRDYVSAHGGVYELKSVVVMLNSTASQLATAEEELNALRSDTDTRSA